jgi:hypothetical protein
MSKTLLMRYVRMVLESDRSAHVPNQLVDDDDTESEGDDKEEAHGVTEFSGVGAIAGYTGPLGIDPGSMGRKKNSSRK